MPVIKRYTNRKLYNTETKQYVTLDEIANLIRRGEEVQVIDNATGEDLTALTLSQIIFEQEKKGGGFLPQSVLTGLVQAGGDTLSSLRRTLAKPLNLLHHVDEEISQRIQSLVKRGELNEIEGQHLLAKLVGDKFRWYDDWQLSEEELLQLLHKHGVPTRADLERLNTQLEALATQIERLGQSKTFDKRDNLNPEENIP
jgi:polyhydroxyalkanoate synthesis repressor PhaR